MLTVACVLTWLMSHATPGVPAISNNLKSETRGLSFISNPNGCPMPPAAPNTATVRFPRVHCCCTLPLPQHIACAWNLGIKLHPHFKNAIFLNTICISHTTPQRCFILSILQYFCKLLSPPQKSLG
jgi:hypothetical protein